ncbi:uncharacterized protein PV09_07562 [Verruconis gallopava]|uniref:Uncharacterized protein n=1 Tax=Verruconis gallopava TaxID=253628 RepID=A0A0D2A2T4_9PEZI|nr:uncharacterized protein PV09_07562 [Verruconis gallopava]KIW01048.1 hypothetical protein PV09_07562 [Verruconis gallopava]
MYTFEQSDNETVDDTISSGNPVSNPETPSVATNVDTVTNAGDDDARDSFVSNETHTSTSYGLELIKSRDEPWTPRVSPRPSQQNLRPEEEQSTSEPIGDNENGEESSGSSQIF